MSSCFLKCPQCNRKCTLKDVRKLFASRVVAIDGESQKVILKFQRIDKVYEEILKKCNVNDVSLFYAENSIS